MKHALINSTHVKKHCKNEDETINVAEARKIMCIIGHKLCAKIKYSNSKVVHPGGVTFYPKIKMRFFDIDEAIETVEGYDKKPFHLRRDFDYKRVIKILKLVLKDRQKYGKMIPDTSDEFEKFYKESDNPKSKKIDYVAVMKAKKEKRDSFSARFKSAEIVWKKDSVTADMV